MNTLETSTIPDETMAIMQALAEKAAAGVRDAEEMRRACERMDARREQIFRRQGVLDIGVPAIRELRDR